MDFFELIQKRQSCRAYNGKPVERNKLEIIVDAARLAPSACNSQPWHFVVVDEPEKAKKTAKLLQDKVVPINRFTDSCPAFVVICEGKAKLSEKVSGRFKGQEFAQIDTGIAAAHLCFAATELGLGCCILGWFDEQGLKNLLHVPEYVRIRLVMAVGYPKEGDPIRPKSRKEMDEIAGYNQW